MDFTEIYPDTCSSVALAARKGDILQLNKLIQEGKSIITKDNRGWQPIHEAAFWNHPDCIATLLNNSN